MGKIIHRLVTYRINNQTGKHIRIIGAKFFTLGEGSYKYGKERMYSWGSVLRVSFGGDEELFLLEGFHLTVLH